MKRWIHAATYNGFDESEFDDSQIYQIRKGLESGVDVSLYADPEFDDHQMYTIRTGLESGLDISWYADPEFNDYQMTQILVGLKDGLDVSQYADPKFSGMQMGKIREALEKGLSANHRSSSNSNSEKWSERMRRYFYDKKSQVADDDDAAEAVAEEACRTYQAVADKAVKIANKQLPADKKLKVRAGEDGLLDVGTVSDIGYEFVDEDGDLIPYDNEFELADELVKFVHEVFM